MRLIELETLDISQGFVYKHMFDGILWLSHEGLFTYPADYSFPLYFLKKAYSKCMRLLRFYWEKRARSCLQVLSWDPSLEE